MRLGVRKKFVDYLNIQKEDSFFKIQSVDSFQIMLGRFTEASIHDFLCATYVACSESKRYRILEITVNKKLELYVGREKKRVEAILRTLFFFY